MRVTIEFLEAEFTALQNYWHALLSVLPEARLFAAPPDADAARKSSAFLSCGESLLRSAGAVEQTFNGMSSSLWDDPFEWTLPEQLATKAAIEEYLAEVETARRRGFALLNADADLQRDLLTPQGQLAVFVLLQETLRRAWYHAGRAAMVAEISGVAKTPRP